MVFITGATGILGSHFLLSLVQTEVKVKALKRAASDLSNVETIFRYHFASDYKKYWDKIEWVEGDILDIISLTSAFKGIEKVIHCAANVSFNPKDRRDLKKVNIFGTENVVNACIETGVKRLLYISSTAALGKSTFPTPVTEETKWAFNTDHSYYGFTKHMAEREVWRGMEEGLEVIILNPCIIVGPGEWGKSSAATFETIANGLKFYTKGSNAFVDVRDVVKAGLLLDQSNLINEQYLTTGENLSFKAFFDLIASKLSVKPPSRLANATMAGIAWRAESIKSLFTGKAPLITKETAQSGQSEVFFSSEKILAQLPQFSFNSIAEAIDYAGNIYLKEKKPR